MKVKVLENDNDGEKDNGGFMMVMSLLLQLCDFYKKELCEDPGEI